MQSRAERYDGVAISFHWAIALLIVANVALAWSLDAFERDSPIQKQFLTIHKSIGVTILILAVLRLAWRSIHRPPPLPESLPPWQRRVADLSHWLLYVVLIVMPISGLIDAGAFSQPVHYFFLFTLPAFIAHNEPLGHAAFAVHKATAVLLYILLAAHAGAALHHHFVRKDDVLRRILP